MPSEAQRADLGVGTYLAPCSDQGDRDLTDGILAALSGGVRMVDTAINYRNERSERVVGAVIRRCLELGHRREEFIVATKAGFVPGDDGGAEDFRRHIRECVEGKGIPASAFTASGHCIDPRFVEWSIRRSLANTGLPFLDVVYLHNPEAELEACSAADLYARLSRSFEVMERLVDAGQLRAFGVATWNAFRVPTGEPEHLELREVVRAAQAVAGDQHHLRFVQVPMNLIQVEAMVLPTQGRGRTLLRDCSELGLSLVTSAALGSGVLRGRVADALDFLRAIPGLMTALVGLSRRSQGEELALRNRAPRLTAKEWRNLLNRLGGGAQA